MLFKALTSPLVATITLYSLMSGNVTAAEDEAAFAFPDKYMFRVGAYIIDGADTQFSVTSDVGGLGTVIDYSRDLGGESRDTIPRIDAYYRFNPRHCIDFTAFSVDRAGERTIAVDPPITIGDETYSGTTLRSDLKYTLYKLGYAYSFYHSEKVELSLSAGLNITEYEFKISDDSGANAESAGFTAPLPMFGLRMSYAITPKWSVNYVAESFFVDFEDTVRGALLYYDLNTEYRVLKNLALGAGVARIGASVDVNDDDWNGSMSDSYRGYTLFATLYF
jgi:hypothetical protein